MNGSLHDDIDQIVGAYDKGIICQGEVINKAIDFTADSEVGEILKILPERFRDLLRERGNDLSPPFEDYLFIESDCSTVEAAEYARRREDARRTGIRGLENVYRYFQSQKQQPG